MELDDEDGPVGPIQLNLQDVCGELFDGSRCRWWSRSRSGGSGVEPEPEAGVVVGAVVDMADRFRSRNKVAAGVLETVGARAQCP